MRTYPRTPSRNASSTAAPSARSVSTTAATGRPSSRMARRAPRLGSPPASRSSSTSTSGRMLRRRRAAGPRRARPRPPRVQVPTRTRAGRPGQRCHDRPRSRPSPRSPPWPKRLARVSRRVGGGGQAMPPCDTDRLDLGMDAELGEDVLDVALHGQGADPEGLCDLGRGRSGRERAQDLPLPTREGRDRIGSGPVRPVRGEATDEGGEVLSPATPARLPARGGTRRARRGRGGKEGAPRHPPSALAAASGPSLPVAASTRPRPPPATICSIVSRPRRSARSSATTTRSTWPALTRSIAWAAPVSKAGHAGGASNGQHSSEPAGKPETVIDDEYPDLVGHVPFPSARPAIP